MRGFAFVFFFHPMLLWELLPSAFKRVTLPVTLETLFTKVVVSDHPLPTPRHTHTPPPGAVEVAPGATQ